MARMVVPVWYTKEFVDYVRSLVETGQLTPGRQPQTPKVEQPQGSAGRTPQSYVNQLNAGAYRGSPGPGQMIPGTVPPTEDELARRESLMARLAAGRYRGAPESPADALRFEAGRAQEEKKRLPPPFAPAAFLQQTPPVKPVTIEDVVGSSFTPEIRVPEVGITSTGQPFYWEKSEQVKERIREKPLIARPWNWAKYYMGRLLTPVAALFSAGALGVRGYAGSPMGQQDKTMTAIMMAKEYITKAWESKPSLSQMEAQIELEYAKGGREGEAFLRPADWYGVLTDEQQAEMDRLWVEKRTPQGVQAAQEYMDAITSNETARNEEADKALTAILDRAAELGPPKGFGDVGFNVGNTSPLAEAFVARETAKNLFDQSYAARAAGNFDEAVTLAEQAIIADTKANPIYNKYYAYTWDRDADAYKNYVHDAALLTVQQGKKLNFEQLERLREYHQSWGTELFGQLLLDPLNLIPGAAWEKMTKATLGAGAKGTSFIDDILRAPSPKLAGFYTGDTYRYLTRISTTALANHVTRDWYNIYSRIGDAYTTRKALVESMDVVQAALTEAVSTSNPERIHDIFETYKKLPGGEGLSNISEREFLILRSHFNDVSGPVAIAKAEQAVQQNAKLASENKFGLARPEGYQKGENYSTLLNNAIEEQEEIIRQGILKSHPELVQIADEAQRAAAVDALVDKALSTGWRQDAGIYAFSKILGESYVDQRRLYEGSRLLEDTLAGKFTRWAKEVAGAGGKGGSNLTKGIYNAAQIIEPALATLWHVRDVWVGAVLYTPRWIVNNLIDSTSRMALYGGNPLSGLQDIFFGIKQEMIDEIGHMPIEFAQSLARENLGFEETVAARTMYEGWVPSFFRNSFWKYEFKRQKDAAAVAKAMIANYPPGFKGAMSRIWNGWKYSDAYSALKAVPGAGVDFNTYIEFALRLRLFHKQYFTLLRQIEPSFKSVAMADVPAHLREMADLIWRNSHGSPSKIKAYTDSLQKMSGGRGVWNFLVPPEIEREFLAGTAFDQKNLISAVTAQLQKIVDMAHASGREPTANEFVRFFEDFREKFRLETQVIMEQNLALRAAEGSISTQKEVVDLAVQSTMKGAAPISEETTLYDAAVARLKVRRGKISRTTLEDFKEVVEPFATIQIVPGNDVRSLATPQSIVIEIGEQVQGFSNAKVVREKLSRALKDSLYFKYEPEILATKSFSGAKDFATKIDEFIADPTAFFNKDAAASNFFVRKLEENPKLRDALEAVNGKVINYEGANLLWEQWGRVNDILTEAGARAHIEQDMLFADAVLAPPPEYRAAGEMQMAATKRLLEAPVKNTALHNELTQFRRNWDTMQWWLDNYYIHVFPGPRLTKVGIQNNSRQKLWDLFYNLRGEGRKSLAAVENKLADMIESGLEDEAFEYIENFNKDFNLNFLLANGVTPVFGGDNVTVAAVTFDFANKKGFEPFGLRPKTSLQARFFSPAAPELSSATGPLRGRMSKVVGEDAANALYTAIYDSFQSKDAQADIWVQIIADDAARYASEAHTTADEYLLRFGIKDGKVVDPEALKKWAVSLKTDALGRSMLFGLGADDVPEMINLSSQQFLKSLYDNSLLTKRSAQDYDVIRKYLELSTGKPIVNGKFLPEHFKAFAQATFKDRATYTFKAGALPPPLLRKIKNPTGENAKLVKWMRDQIDRAPFKTDAVVLAILPDNSVFIVDGKKVILDALEAGKTQIPVTVVTHAGIEKVSAREAYDLLIGRYAPLQGEAGQKVLRVTTRYKEWLANIRRMTLDSEAIETAMNSDVERFLTNLMTKQEMVPVKNSMVREVRAVAKQLGIEGDERVLVRIINDFVDPRAAEAVPPPAVVAAAEAAPAIAPPPAAVPSGEAFEKAGDAVIQTLQNKLGYTVEDINQMAADDALFIYRLKLSPDEYYFRRQFPIDSMVSWKNGKRTSKGRVVGYEKEGQTAMIELVTKEAGEPIFLPIPADELTFVSVSPALPEERYRYLLKKKYVNKKDLDVYESWLEEPMPTRPVPAVVAPVVEAAPAAAEVAGPTNRIHKLIDLQNPGVAYDAFLDYARKNHLTIPQETIKEDLSAAWQIYKRAREFDTAFPAEVLASPDSFYDYLHIQMQNSEGEMYEHYRFLLIQMEQFRDAVISKSLPEMVRDVIFPAPLEADVSDGVRQWIKANEYSIYNFERVERSLGEWERYMIDMAKGKHPALSAYTSEDYAALNKFAVTATQQKADLVGTLLHGGKVNGRDTKGAISFVNKIMLDYQTRNNFDMIMKNVFPFWMFPSRSIPFWAETMMLHPELVAFYNKIKMASRTARTEAGALNSAGDPLPRLDGYLPMYLPGLKDPVWFNPLSPLSFRYVFTPIEQYEDMEYRARYEEQDLPPLAYIVRDLDESSRVYGFNMAPWVLWTVKSAFNIDDNIMPQFPLIPEISLIPRHMVIDMMYMARRKEFPGYENVDLVLDLPFLPPMEWYPEVPWHNYLVEKQLLLNAQEKISESNWTDAQKIAYLSTVRSAIQYKGGNTMWQDAYKQVTQTEAGKSWISFFTAFYPKEFSDAEADMLTVRNDINALRMSLNNEVLIEIFDRPPDSQVRYQEYVDAIQTPPGYLNQLYSEIGWVTNPEGQVIYEPKERARALAAEIDQSKSNAEYYDALEAAMKRRDDALFALPIGAPFEQTAPIWEQYGLDVSNAQARYNPYYEYQGSSKPSEELMKAIAEQWYRFIYGTRPRWNKDKGETYDDYQIRYAEWEAKIPAIAGLLKRRFQGQTLVHAIVSNLHEDQSIPDEFWNNLYDSTNSASVTEYKKRNDTVFDALNGAWSELYWSPYWDAVQDKKGYERELAERDFLAAHPSPPTPEEMWDWIVREYGVGRFDEKQTLLFASGKTEYTVQERQEYGTTQNEQLRDSIWDMFSWIAPGKARDLLQEQFVKAGGDRDTISSWYDGSGYLYQGRPDETAALMSMQASLQQALSAMHALPPTRDQLVEYIQAQSEQAYLQEQITKTLGNGFWTIFNYYNELESAEKRVYRSEFAANYKLIQDYYLMRDAYAKTNPIWAKYYYTAQTGGGYGGSSGYYSSGRRRYSGGGGGSSSRSVTVGLTQAFRTAGGTAGLLARYVASLPPSFATVVSPTVVQEMAAAALLNAPMSAAGVKYLGTVSKNHPEFQSIIASVTSMKK